MPGSAKSYRKGLGLVGVLFAVAGAGILVAQTTDSDEPWDRDEAAAYFEGQRVRNVEREREGGLHDPLLGITADGRSIPGLYSIKSTGVSTEPIISAAKSFLNTLDPDQRSEAMFPVTDIEWRRWDNRASYARDGVWFQTMTDEQRQAAFAMLGASLSADGLETAQGIMKTNETLGELTGDYFAKYGQWKYWISMMGEPSATEPWGWQLDGHHLAINYTVVGDQVVMTPALWGAEPIVARDGKFKGTRVLTAETEAGLDMIQALTPDQQAEAIIQQDKDATNILTQAFSDNVIVPYAGIPVARFDDRQKELLKKLIGLWVGKMRNEHARIRMAEVEQYLDQTWFAWIGNTDDDAVFYYRIQSPVILIEFDHQRPQGLANLYDHNNAYRDHIHAVVRTPNGNDYGADLLRQHYANHAHGEVGPDGKPFWHGRDIEELHSRGDTRSFQQQARRD